MAEYQVCRFGEIPNQFAADGYDASTPSRRPSRPPAVTADMSNEEICDALIAAMQGLSITGLTSAGSEMTWDANGAVSKTPSNGHHRERPTVGVDP